MSDVYLSYNCLLHNRLIHALEGNSIKIWATPNSFTHSRLNMDTGPFYNVADVTKIWNNFVA